MRIAIAILALLLSPTLGIAGGTCSGVKGGCGRSAYRSEPRSSAPSSGGVYVNGYTRSDGTYVRPHMRSAPGNAGISQKAPEPPVVRFRSSARTTARTSVWTGGVTDSIATMAPVVERRTPQSHAIPEVARPKLSRPITTPVDDPLLRVWTDRTGNFTLTARFGGMLGTTVTLRKLDGTPIKLEFDRLSEADQAWINSRKHQ